MVQFRFLFLLVLSIVAACQEEKSQKAPAPAPAPAAPSTQPPAPKRERDHSESCRKLATKLAQCKKEIIHQEFRTAADAVVSSCNTTLKAEEERSDSSLKLLDLLQEKAEADSCRGSVNGDCSVFVSCLVTRRRNEVCHPSRAALIRVSTQEIQVNGKTAVFVAGTRIAGQPEDAEEIAPLADRIAELRKTAASPLQTACINADPDVPWVVVERVSRTARGAGLTRQAFISQQLTPEKVDALLETAASPLDWTLPDDLLPWGIPGATGENAPAPVTVRVTAGGYDVLVGGRSLCPAQNRRGIPCIPRVTVEGQTVHNPVALRQFLYENHVLPFWKSRNAKPGEALPSAGELYLGVADPSIPYKVVTATLDGLRPLPASALKEWGLPEGAVCRLDGDWLAQGRVERFSGACLYPVVYVASADDLAAMEQNPANPSISVMMPDNPDPMNAPASMLEIPPDSAGGIGASDKGLIPPGAPLEVRRWLGQKKWAIVACFQKAGARGFAHQGTVSVTMEMKQGTARVLSMGGSLAAIPSFLQCCRETLHQKTVGTSDDTRAFETRWTFSLQLKGAASE